MKVGLIPGIEEVEEAGRVLESEGVCVEGQKPELVVGEAGITSLEFVARPTD
jgi:hypothetical protein